MTEEKELSIIYYKLLYSTNNSLQWTGEYFIIILNLKL